MNGETTSAFLSRIQNAGITLTAEGENLRFLAPPGTMTAELRSEIGERKREILRCLRDSHSNGQPMMASERATAQQPVEDVRVEADSIPVVPRTGPLPLSHEERRLWFLHHRLPKPSAYNIAWAVRLHGSLDRRQFGAAFAALLERHEILRTAFVERDGEPVRVIAEPRPSEVPLIFEKLVPKEGEPVESALTNRFAAEAERPFDLAAGPLLRVLLVEVGALDHALLITIHHIIVDEWSTQILRQELAALCAANGDIAAAGLPSQRIQYADFAAWQRRRVASPEMAKHREYWRAHLANAQTAIELPLDHKPPATFMGTGGVSHFSLSPALVRQLEGVGHQEGATGFVVWLAAYVALLWRLSGQNDLLVATPLAQRHRPEVQHMLGFFLNMLPIRVRVNGADGFRALVRAVRTAVLDGFEHGDLPLDEIVAESRLEQSSSSLPGLFPVMFVLQHESPEAIFPAGATAQPVRGSHTTTKALLTLFLRRDREGALSGSIEYSDEVFTGESIERIIGQFREFVTTLASGPDRALASAPWMPDQQRRDVLKRFNPARAAYPRERTVDQIFAEQAARAPESVALICGNQTLTYRQLASRVRALAAHLRRLGAKPGTFVALHLGRSIEFVAASLAVLETGAAYVPLDLHSPAERLRLVLDDTRSAIVLAHGFLPAELRSANVRVLDVGDVPAASPADQAETTLPRTSGDAAYVMYTSGSTGRPKGVVVPHRAIARLVQEQTYATFAASDRFLMLASPAFDASTFELWGPLLNGATCVIAPQALPDLDEIETVIRAHDVTCAWFTSGLFNQIVDQRPSILAALRHAITGGEALSVPHVRRALAFAPSLRLTNGYGPTESTTFACTFEISRESPWACDSVPIGRPIAHTSCYILDEWRNPVPIHVAGELYIGGDGLALGYLNQPDLTAEKFVPDPFSGDRGARLYRTGDRCRWLANGTIEFLGRFDEQVKIRGYRVELGEIEAALTEFDGVAEAAVFTRTGAAAGTLALTGVVVPKPGAAIDVAQLRAHLVRRLPSYMIPASFVVQAKRLPLTANGKVDRRTLSIQTPVTVAARAAIDAPRNTIEIELVEIWSRMLGVPQIGVRDNFFEIGGNSLLAMRLAREIQQRLGRQLSLVDLLQGPTIEQVALRLVSTDSGRDARRRLRGTGAGTPFFHVPGIDGVGLLPQSLVTLLEGERQYFDALQYPGIDGREPPCDRVESIAAAVLNQIKRVRPHGPYSLSGFCFGGLVAYEIARILETAGERVETLILWDAVPRRVTRRRPIRHVIAILFNRSRRAGWREWMRLLAQRIPRKATRVLKQRVRGVTQDWLGSANQPVEISKSASIDDVAQRLKAAGNRALARYEPGPYSGRIDLFRTKHRAVERILEEPIPLNGWHGLIRGPLNVYDIECGHHDLLHEPVVSRVAELTVACLRAAQGESRLNEAPEADAFKSIAPSQANKPG